MKKKNFFKDHKKLMIFLIILLILAAATFFVMRSIKSRMAGPVGISYTTAEVSRQTIQKSISGSGSLQPANSYTVSARFSGEITADRIEEGDIVEKDQELYVIDSSEDEDETDDDRYISPDVSGYISQLFVEEGDEVKTGQQIAEIIDTDTMKLTLRFSSVDAEKLSVGQTAAVVMDNTFEELSGEIISVSNFSETGEDNISVKKVGISVKNPGSLGLNQAATAYIGDIESMESGTFEYNEKQTVTAAMGGTVQTIRKNEGERVSAGQTIAVLEKEDDSDKYFHSVTSPINGTIVDKSLKKGENAESGRTLCTIYDLSYLEMNLSVDELDIASVAVGQEVEITADATGDTKYSGYVSKVSIAGSSMGGTATYPVTVRIDDYGTLLPSMNVDAVIVIDEAENTLAVPNTSILRGDRILITQDSPSAKALLEAGETPDENGYIYAEVVTGLSDDDYTEIKSGLQDGDVIAYSRQGSSSGDMMFPGMGGFGGGMPGGSGGFSGGGMPSGGPSGGRMPSGGFSGGGRGGF